MHAVRTGCQRHVDAIVDEHPRLRPADGLDTSTHQRRQRAAIEIALPHLHEMYAGTSGPAHALDEEVGATCPRVPIGDE